MTFKKLVFVNLAFSVLFSCVCLGAEERTWKDATGHFEIKGELIAYNSKTIVLEKSDKSLVSFDIKDLSKDDKKHVYEIRMKEKRFASPDSLKTWKMKSGLLVNGRVVSFATRDVLIQSDGEQLFVNDKAFKNLPPVYQSMLPDIVEHFDKVKIADGDALKEYVNSLPNGQKVYTCEGVLFELKNGDRYGVPLFFFSQLDLTALTPAWQRWKAAKQKAEKDQESFYLRAQSEASYDEKEDIRKMRQISELKLQLQAYDAGLFDLWQVELIPPNYGRRMIVVVGGRNSDQAAEFALQKYPGNRVGAIAKVRRRR